MTTAEIIALINGKRIGELLLFNGTHFELPEDHQFKFFDEAPKQLRTAISELCQFAEGVAAYTSVEAGTFSIDVDHLNLVEKETVCKYLSQPDGDKFLAALILWIKGDKHLNGWSIFRPLMVKMISSSIGARYGSTQ